MKDTTLIPNQELDSQIQEVFVEAGKEQAPENLVLIEEARFKIDFARSKGVDVTPIYIRYLKEASERSLQDSIQRYGLTDEAVKRIRDARKRREQT